MATYVQKNENQLGPFDDSQILTCLKDGTFTHQDMSWREGWRDWQPLGIVFPAPTRSSPASPQDISEPGVTNSTGGQTLWIGHASHWNYFWSWCLGILLLAAVIGVFIIIWIFIDRARRVYIVATRRIVFQAGLFLKSTNELRIKDIRSINVTKRGLAGLMGIGSVEFSSAATDRAEIIFTGIAGANKIRDMVRRLQDEA
jgi:membrane protein YdbS with pleckstrin-like domain